MTRFIACLSLAVLALGSLPDTAHAKRGIGAVALIHEEVLRPVAALDAQTGLCHLIERRSLFGILGYWMASKGYVAGAAGCAGDSYRSLTAPVAEMQAQGAFPIDLPETPAFTARDYAEGFGLWAALAALIAVAVATRGMSRRKRSIRQQILTLEDGPAFRLIDVMCHAAIADGRIDPAEIAYVRELAREVTGLDYSERHIREAISRADKLKRPRDLAAFAEGLTLEQRHLILQAALSVVAADGEMDKRENRFIGLLVAGFGLARDDLDQALNILANRRANAAPA